MTYAVNEKWCGDATETGSGNPPSCYRVLKAREFRYDGGRQRYLDRSLNACDFQNGIITPLANGTKWTDYDGDEPYGDYTVTVNTPPTAPTITNVRSFELGMARVDPWTDGSLGVGENNTAYYHADMLGTTRMMASASGASIEPAILTAFGEKIVGPTNGASTRYGYVGSEGYQAHEDMPFLHVGARYYDPRSGRFLQRDPIGITGGLNVYAYVENLPSTWTDPDGRQKQGRSNKWRDGEAAYLLGCTVMWAYGDDCCTELLGYPGSEELARRRNERERNRERERERERERPRPKPRPPTWRPPVGGTGIACFVAGTPVVALGQDVPIERADVQLRLVAGDNDSLVTTSGAITAVFQGIARNFVTLTIDDERLTCTPEHPFFVVNKGWTRASELISGDQLQTLEGVPATIDAIESEFVPSGVPIYNVTVDGVHTFYVGKAHVLVHNKHG